MTNAFASIWKTIPYTLYKYYKYKYCFWLGRTIVQQLCVRLCDRVAQHDKRTIESCVKVMPRCAPPWNPDFGHCIVRVLGTYGIWCVRMSPGYAQVDSDADYDVPNRPIASLNEILIGVLVAYLFCSNPIRMTIMSSMRIISIAMVLSCILLFEDLFSSWFCLFCFWKQNKTNTNL